MENVTYIHYGHSKFDREKFLGDIIKYPLRSKPSFGLWGSRTNSDYGWIDWCRDQSFDENEEFGFGDFSSSFKFSLTKDAKILNVHDEDDIVPYLIKSEYCLSSYHKTDVFDGINFNKMKEEGYDGLELFMSDNYPIFHHGVFNAWDCDSIVVWNPDVIKEE